MPKEIGRIEDSGIKGDVTKVIALCCTGCSWNYLKVLPGLGDEIVVVQGHWTAAPVGEGHRLATCDEQHISCFYRQFFVCL